MKKTTRRRLLASIPARGIPLVGFLCLACGPGPERTPDPADVLAEALLELDRERTVLRPAPAGPIAIDPRHARPTNVDVPRDRWSETFLGRVLDRARERGVADLEICPESCAARRPGERTVSFSPPVFPSPTRAVALVAVEGTSDRKEWHYTLYRYVFELREGEWGFSHRQGLYAADGILPGHEEWDAIVFGE